MKISHTISELESIPKATIYSKYGISLNRLFKSKSLKNLIVELKNPKKFIPKGYNPLTQILRKEKYNDEENKDIFSTLYMNNIDKNKEENLKKLNLKKSTESLKYKFRGKKKLLGFMDPFKYNPNYNSISKNIPSVHMILGEKEAKELEKIREKQKIKKKKRKLIIEHFRTENAEIKKTLPKVKTKNEENFITLMNTDNTEKISRKSSSKSRKLPPLYKVNEQKERYITIDNDYNLKNNHALRFSKYIPRKFDFNNKDKTDKITYLEPYDYLNKGTNNFVDFRKMAYRKDKDMIYFSSLEVPSFNNYNPKFDLVEKKASQIVFSPRIEKKNSKQYLLRKLWSSYKVEPDYKLVNNDKLLKQ